MNFNGRSSNAQEAIIRPNSSARNSLIGVVLRKSEISGKSKRRMVVDFRNVNEKPIDDSNLIPNTK